MKTITMTLLLAWLAQGPALAEAAAASDAGQMRFSIAAGKREPAAAGKPAIGWQIAAPARATWAPDPEPPCRRRDAAATAADSPTGAWVAAAHPPSTELSPERNQELHQKEKKLPFDSKIELF